MMNSIVIRHGLSIPLSDIRFEFARSGGPGGQHVNKVATKVELVFDVPGSTALSAEQKAAVCARLASRIRKDGILRISADESRSQWRNRELAVRKFADLIAGALAARRKRRATKPTPGGVKERRETKQRRSATKRLRGPVRPDD